MALYVHKMEIIDALLHHGANVSILDGHGNSVLHIACEENSQAMLECLLKFASTSRDVYMKFFQMLKGKNNQGLIWFSSISFKIMKTKKSFLPSPFLT